MIAYKNAAVAAVACALAVSALGGGAQAAAAQPVAKSSAGEEVDRNLIKPPPGGVLAPVADVVGQVLSR
ncbi:MULTISPECIES: hypothetical protein [Streptomyces]|uniref:ATP-binding protein n=2 Tax=Streptomyces TaxID=1883 RepID=A0A646KRF2_STRJU|nr:MULTISPECIES: hypothetical protein [Streptomyces]MQS35400.1 hypothetical protein [Streptomyces katsurahamanus]MQT04441.1 hypothetical protein [Streptomyces jumonjinensis]